MNEPNPRYPYTYAADYIRMNARNLDGSLLSRSTAAQIQQVIADALGIDKETISRALADKFILHYELDKN